MHDQRPRTPPSPAVRALEKVLYRPQTPRFDPKVHKSEDLTTSAGVKEEKDAFAEAIISRSEVKTLSYENAFEELKHSQMENEALPSQEEPCIVQSKSNSPTKSITRIEDSVEALDAFEEEIEKVGELLPAMDDEHQLPAKNMDLNKSRTGSKDVGKPTSADGRRPSTRSKPAATRNNVAKAIRKDTSPKQRQLSAARSAQPATRKPTTAASISRTSSVKPMASSRTSSVKPATTTKTSPTVSATGPQPTTHARVSSLQKPPFQPTKSSKPPTRSTFSLPGEAISRKLKEQREERLKKVSQTEADQDTQKKTFKARPVRLSHAPVVVKGTATSMARMSLAKGEPVDVKDGAPKIKSTAARQSVASAAEGKRLSSLSVAKHAPTTAVTNPYPSRSASLSSRTSLTTRPAPATAGNGVRQTSRGKEVFGRTKAELEAREKEKKEKEEAAKRARAEAAERGRLASRAWAEKMKARKAGAAVGNGDVMGEEKGVQEVAEGEVVGV